jgi:CelD/BcsL family acetyltransferase involved in cellulose biosynthesis/RimJ/RimL family protein N-acetyltransferase
VLRSRSEIEALRDDWERLWRARGIRHVFQSFGWHLAVLDAHPEREVRVLVACRGGRTIAILPLAIVGGRVRFLGVPYADYNDMLAEPEHAGAALSAMLAAIDAARLAPAVLDNVREDALLREAIAALDGAPRLSQAKSGVCPVTLLGADREQVLDEIQKKKSLRRHEKKLAALGQVELRHVTDLKTARAMLPRFFDQHTARRVVAGGGMRFDDAATRAFYGALIDRLGLETVRFAVLTVDERPVAFHFGFEFERHFVWYKPAFDVDLWDLGPGEVLLKRLFEYAGERGVVEVDFTIGDEGFKDRFANRTREVFAITVLPVGIAGVATRLTRSAKDALKRHPTLFAATKKLRSRFAAGRGALARHGIVGLTRKLWTRAARSVRSSDEVEIFRRARADGVAASDPGLVIHAAGLARLAGLVAGHPDDFHEGKMRSIRKRLADGDELFVAELDGEFAHVAWLGQRDEIVASSEVGDEVRLPLPRRGAVIYDCWTPPAMRGRGVYPRVLRELAARAPCDDVWIYCHRTNVASARGILRAGFRPSHRMGVERWRGHARRTWLVEVDAGDPLDTGSPS